jgi:hypothetical protein
MRTVITVAAVCAATAFATLGLPSNASAQGERDSVPVLYGEGLKVTINEKDDMYIRFLLWAQVWTRATQMAPGSTVDGSTKEWQLDVFLRRVRFMTYAQLTDRVLILMHFGINNLTFTNGGFGGDAFRAQIYFHDVWVEFRALKDYLFVGAGLLYWNGISRMTSASTLNFLALDAPILNWPTLDITDQFVRQLGLYAKGEIDQFHYRVALTRPFIRDTEDFVEPDAAFQTARFNAFANTWALSGYFNYDFFTKENHLLPFFVGTYLGTEKVLNVGAGFSWQPSAMVSCSTAPVAGVCPEDNQRIEDLVLVGVDLFADIPIRRSALATYLVYYNYDFGPDFVRNVGVANLTAGTSGSGPGNAYPSIGTGNHLYWQVGYLLPFRPLNRHKITPYFTIQTSFLEALDDPSMIYELGVKYYFIGHHSSITFNWRNRPVFGVGELDAQTDEVFFVPTATQQSRANELIIQLMVWL